MTPMPYLSPLRFGDLRYSTLDVDRNWPTPPPEPNCRCAVVVLRFSGNAHQRRIKRRAWERARRKEAKPFRPHLYNSPTGAGGFSDGQQPRTVVTL